MCYFSFLWLLGIFLLECDLNVRIAFALFHFESISSPLPPLSPSLEAFPCSSGILEDQKPSKASLVIGLQGFRAHL